MQNNIYSVKYFITVLLVLVLSAGCAGVPRGNVLAACFLTGAAAGATIAAVSNDDDSEGEVIGISAVSGGLGGVIFCGVGDSPSAPPKPVEEATADSDADGVPDVRDVCPNTSPRYNVDGIGCPVLEPEEAPPPTTKAPLPRSLDGDGDGKPDEIDRCPGTLPGTPVGPDGCPEVGETLAVLEDVHFEFDDAGLTGLARTMLDEVIRMLKANLPMHVSIEGHADSIGTDRYNLSLSERRAQTVYAYLINAGIPAERLSIRGAGEREPIADNKTASGRALNRRVEFVVTHK